MKDENKHQNEISENVPAVVASDDTSGVAPIAEESLSAPSVADARALSVTDKSAPADPTDVHEYDRLRDGDESMRGGYASVKGQTVKANNRMIWIIVALMAALSIAVGVLSSTLTGYFMRRGEKPPVINTNGDVQQNIAAVIAARKSSIAEVACGGLKGSGIVMKRDGETVYVLTNAHVLESYVMIEQLPAIRFYGEDGFYQAAVVGYDAFYDVAVLSIDHTTVHTVYDLDGSEFFSPDVKYNEGDYVVSIGNAMGMGIASYDGIISRASEMLECNEIFNAGGKKTVPVMRTTAVINAGMSGGGVFDMQGHLIGLGTYRMSNSDGVDTEGGASTDVEDTGFATPISVLYPVYKRIMAEGNGGAVRQTSVTLRASDTSAIGRVSMPFGYTCEYRNGRLTVVALNQGTPPKTVSVGDVVTRVGNLRLIDDVDGESSVNSDVCALVGTLLGYSGRGDGAALTIALDRDGSPLTVVYDDYRYAL
ncbi:MAG: serine protease [Clostridiales bacterium]|nr:serine protease [Clostridiales bacterium]